MEKKLSINRNQLKYIAIIAMVIDHIGWRFFTTGTVTGQILHFIGRLTGPIMAYMLYEGYMHTRNVAKYALRLGIFALISWVPYSLYETRKWPTLQFGVIYTLFLALLTIWMWDKANIKKGLKILLVIVACLLSFMGDWPVMDILWPLFLFIYRDEPKRQWRSFIIIIAVEAGCMNLMAILSGQPFSNVFQLGAFMVPPLIIYLYNGESGSKKAFHKWFFYVFYPLHLLIIWALKVYVFK